MRDLMNTSEAAEFLRVSKRTLALWRSSGKGPKWSKIGRFVRYTRASIEAYVHQGETPCAGSVEGQERGMP